MLGACGIFFASVVYLYYRFQQRSDEFTPQARVDLSRRGAPESTLPPEPRRSRRQVLRVAVAPVISPERSLQTYAPFVGYLGRKLARRPVLLPRATYSEVNDFVRFKQCDMALVCSYAFVLGEREFGMRLLAVPRIGGAIVYHSYIITGVESAATSLLDFGGRRFASADVMSSSGWLYPVGWLKERGKDAAHFFSEHLITGSHDRSILAVVAGLADAAAVDSLVYDGMTLADPDLAKKTKVIDISPPFGIPPVVVPEGIDLELERSLRDALLSMHRAEVGRKVLSALRVDRFVAPESSLYESVRRAAAEWEK